MPAPKGSQFWKLRATHGREKIFATPEILWESACEYFQWCDDNPLQKPELIKSGELAGKTIYVDTVRPYSMQGLCVFLDVNTAYFRQFKDRADENFSTIIQLIEDTVYSQKFDYAAIGVFNANLIARSIGLAEKTSNEHTGAEGAPLFDTLSDDDIKARIVELLPAELQKKHNDEK